MKLIKGSVVRANAGRDSGDLFVVVEIDEKFCSIANGKSRKLISPKRKNKKHLCHTNSMIDINGITDKKLRKLLKDIKSKEQEEVI